MLSWDTESCLEQKPALPGREEMESVLFVTYLFFYDFLMYMKQVRWRRNDKEIGNGSAKTKVLIFISAS